MENICMTSLKALFLLQYHPKSNNFMHIYKLQSDNLPFLSCALITLCMVPASVLRSMAHSSVTSHSSPDPSPSPSVSIISCKTKCQTAEGKISTRSIHYVSAATRTFNHLKQPCKFPSAKLLRQTE